MANVIKTVMTYPLNGSTRDFNIPFEYLARKFVQVTLLGKDRKVLTLNTDYRFSTKTTLTTTQAWGSAQGYDQIEIRRYTSATERLVDFTDGSILRAYDLNVSQIQTMHVAEEARDLTADTIGVNNEGHLDARNRRIVNVANAISDRDAVPFGQLKTMNQNAWDAQNKAQQFRNEAQTFRNQAESFKNETNNLKNQAAASQTAAKTSETNAKASENAARASQNAAAASQSAAKTSETNAKTSETNAKKSADAAKVSENNAKTSEKLVISNVQSYGALPIGTVIATPINKAPAGFLKLDGSKFDKSTYDALFTYLGTDTLPDWRNRYLKGALNDGEVGVLKGWGLPARNGTAKGAGGHNHTGTTSSNGAHTHTVSGTTSSSGAHTHSMTIYHLDTSNQQVRPGAGGHNVQGSGTYNTGSAGAHTHTFNGTTSSTGAHTHTMTTNTVADHTHVLEIPAMGTGVMDVDHVKVHWWIKAYGTTNAEQMAKVDAALQTIHNANSKVESYESRVKFIEETRKPLNVPNVPGTNTWYKLGRVRMGQYSAGLLITGTGQMGNNIQTGVSNQGITWMAKVWTSNNNPKAFVSQVNMFGGNVVDVALGALPIQGIAVVEEPNSDYGTIYMKLGAYGNAQMLFVEGAPYLLREFVAADGGNSVVAENPPSTARWGFLSYTHCTKQFTSAL